MNLKVSLLATAAATFSLTNAAEPSTLSLGGYEETDDSGENLYNGAVWQHAPILFHYGHSGAQIIYTANELQEMANANITAIKFKYYNEGVYCDYSSTSQLYLQESEQTAFEKDEIKNKYKWIPFDSETPNCEVDFTTYFGEDGGYTDNEFIFDLSDTPFTYEGKSLILTVVNDGVDGTYADNALPFYMTDLRNRALVHASDSEDFFSYIADNTTAENNSYLIEAPTVQFVYSATESGVAENVTTINSVAGADNAISLVLGAAAKVQVYTTAGQLVASEALSAGNHSIAANQGIYVVRINNNTYKAIVK